MRFPPRSIAIRRCLSLAVVAALIQASVPAGFASAYNAHPKLIVAIAIDHREDRVAETAREGHDFSRAENPPSSTAASAAEGRSQSEKNERRPQ
jgi:hypothetical protein